MAAHTDTPSAAVRAATLIRITSHHGTWWWRILIAAKAWQFLIPFPLGWLLAVVQNWGAPAESKQKPKDSAWVTLAILVAWYLWQFPGETAYDPLVKPFASDAAKILFPGAFLLGTILSVSVALPGQTILRAVMDDDPDFAVAYVVPFMWALLWGVFGGVVMLFYGSLPPVAKKLAVAIAVYAATMELHAIVHTMRMYLLGLLMMVSDKGGDDTSTKDAAATALPAQSAAPALPPASTPVQSPAS